MQGSFNELILIHSLISSSAFPALHVLSTPLYITSAEPEKCSQAVTLTVSSSFPCLDWHRYSFFNPSRSHTIQTRYFDTVKESYCSLAGGRKEDFVGRWGGVYVFPGWQTLQLCPILILSLFFPISRCDQPAWHVFWCCHTYKRMPLTFNIRVFFFSGAQSRIVCTMAAKETHLKLGQVFVLPRREAFWHMQYFTCL